MLHLRRSALQRVSCGVRFWPVECESRGWLGRQGEFEPLQDDLLIDLRLGIARQDDFAAVGGRQVDIDHADRRHFLEHRSRREAGGQGAQPLLVGDLEALGDEGDEDMGFDAMVELVVDRPDRKIALEFFEGLLDLAELHVEPPQAGRIIVTKIAA